MYPQSLYPKTKQVLDRLKNISLFNDFYLAGGTGLALQLGHRKSIDLDFFTKTYPKRDTLLSNLKIFRPTIIQEALGTLDTTIDDVKVSFLEYKYPLLTSPINFEGVNLASVLDIAAMKLSAISSRGSKKDFIDIYFILKDFPLDQLFAYFEEKFEGVAYQKLHILKSLSFFDDAINEPQPDMLIDVDWEEVKASIENNVKNYIKSLN